MVGLLGLTLEGLLWVGVAGALGPLLPGLTELLEDALTGPSRAGLLATGPDSPYRVLLDTLTNLEKNDDSACSGCCPPCRCIIVKLLTL